MIFYLRILVQTGPLGARRYIYFIHRKRVEKLTRARQDTARITVFASTSKYHFHVECTQQHGFNL